MHVFLIRAFIHAHVIFMKTITLDDEAYGLLKMWKTSGRESFSMVVKQIVSVPGTPVRS
jgi:hypothetical protein